MCFKVSRCSEKIQTIINTRQRLDSNIELATGYRRVRDNPCKRYPTQAKAIHCNNTPLEVSPESEELCHDFGETYR